MRRFVMATVTAALALGSALVLPVAAQAQPLPPPGGPPPIIGPPPRLGNWTPTGTFSDPVSCENMGQALHAAIPEQNQRWMCQYGTPTPGVWNLMIYFVQAS